MGVNLCTRLQWLNEHALPRKFISVNNANVFCLVSSDGAAGFPATSAQWSFTRHCGWHRNFQLSTRILHDILEFFSPLLLFFAFRCIGHIFPNLGTKCLSWRSFVLSREDPGKISARFGVSTHRASHPLGSSIFLGLGSHFSALPSPLGPPFGPTPFGPKNKLAQVEPVLSRIGPSRTWPE